MRSHSIEVPAIVRIKPGALGRMGLYLARPNLRRIFLVYSHGLVPAFEEWFEARSIPFAMRYFDPSYIVRSSPDNAEDTILCDQFARHAAHAAMAGKAGLVIGLLHDRFIHVPIELLATQQKRIEPAGSAWSAVLTATGQPHRFA